MKDFLFILFVVMTATAAGESGGNPEDLFSNAVELFRRGDYAQSAGLLKQCQQLNPALFRLNNGYYLLGRALKETHNYSEAIVCFREALKDSSLLGFYARYDMAECFKGLKMYSAAITEYQILDYDPLETRRDMSIAEVYGLQEKYVDAITAYTRIKVSHRSSSWQRQLNLRIGEMYEKMGQKDRALSLYYSMLDDEGLNDETFQAIHRIERLEYTNKLEEGDSAIRTYLRGKTVYKLGMYRRAVDIFRTFIRKYPDDRLLPEVYYMVGRCLVRDEAFLQAVEAFQEGLQRFPEGKFAKRSRHQLAQAYFQLADEEKGRWQLRKMLTTSPPDFLADFAIYELAQSYERTGDWTKTLRYYKDLIRQYPRSSITDNALWNSSRIYIRFEEYEKTIETLDRLVREFPGSDLCPEARLWTARCLAMKSDRAQAEEAFRGILRDYPYHLYARFASEYLQREYRGMLTGEQENEIKATLDNAKQNMVKTTDDTVLDRLLDTYLLYPETRYRAEIEYVLDQLFQKSDDGRKAYQLTAFSPRPFFIDKDAQTRFWETVVSTESFKRGLELYSLGDLDRGFEEMEHEWNRRSGDLDMLYNLALLSNKAERYHRSIRYAYYLTNRLTSKSRFILLPDSLKRLVYPAGFGALIKKYAAEYKLEPEMIAAIIYQESRFDPDAVSPAAAKGLMQIIPRTGTQIAEALEKNDYDENSLLVPRVSIQMGSWYFRQLVDEFNNQFEVAMASYNGGPHNAKRWLKLCQSNDPLEFIGAITFKETRNYVKIVMRNYFIYKDLYGATYDWS